MFHVSILTWISSVKYKRSNLIWLKNVCAHNCSFLLPPSMLEKSILLYLCWFHVPTTCSLEMDKGLNSYTLALAIRLLDVRWPHWSHKEPACDSSPITCVL